MNAARVFMARHGLGSVLLLALLLLVGLRCGGMVLVLLEVLLEVGDEAHDEGVLGGQPDRLAHAPRRLHHVHRSQHRALRRH